MHTDIHIKQTIQAYIHSITDNKIESFFRMMETLMFKCVMLINMNVFTRP